MASQLHCCTERRATKLQNSVADCRMILISILVLSTLYRTAVCEGLPIEPFGYINLDCGGEDGYNDTLTGLGWVWDKDYLESSDRLLSENLTFSTKVVMNDSSVTSRNNAQQLGTARIFMFRKSQLNDSYTKYCYRFNLSLSNNKSSSYLVRAMFPPRNLSNSSGVPNGGTSEIFYLGVDTSLFPVVPDEYEPVTVELLVTSLDDNLDICLLPDMYQRENAKLYAKLNNQDYYDYDNADAVAAMSSLEIRSVPELLYPVFDRGKFDVSGRTVNPTVNYYVTLCRLNFGGNESSPAIRYPLDKYDRLWYGAPRGSYLWDTERNSKEYYWYREPDVYELERARTMVDTKTDPRSKFEFKSMNFSAVSGESSAVNDLFQVPPAVWASAWEGVNLNSTISFSLDVGSSWMSHRTEPFYYSLSIVFFDVNADTEQSRSVSVSNKDEDDASQWILQDANVPTTRPYIWSEGRFDFYGGHIPTFEIGPAANSTLPAMINALELYGVVENVYRKTYSDSVSSARILLDNSPISSHIDSFGDPCLPLPWNWVKCGQLKEGAEYIEEINLRSRGLQGNLTEDFKLQTWLQVLDLSNNSFHGILPSTFSTYSNLAEL
ncbi:hypothetical protein R1sor_016607 [Riccia sorocarpa]|uniref:Malectin-like domain-containing protein n=1 Tax=Riccia sorocarpa TaxID=122646 RepID=A0ABD3HFV7_9MARC